MAQPRSQSRTSPRCSPRNSSSVRRFLWVRRKERSPSRPAGDPRETMSKRMGLLKTLRTGGGLGAGAFMPGACFLQEKHQHWGPEPLPQFPTHAMSLRVLSCHRRAWAAGGTPQPGSPTGTGQPPHPQQPSSPQHPTSQYCPQGPVGILPAPSWVLQYFGPPSRAPSQQGRASSSVTLQRRGQSQTGRSSWQQRDNRPAPGTGNGGGGGWMSVAPARGLWGRRHVGHPGPSTHPHPCPPKGPSQAAPLG